jgi:hypothetical protein
VDLPKAEDLAAIFKAARDAGVTRLRIGALEATLAPYSQADIVAAINRENPIPKGPPGAPAQDPFAAIRGRVNEATDERPDVLDALANGARLVAPIDGDPTQPS